MSETTANTSPTSSYLSFLMYKATSSAGSYAQLTPVNDYSDVEGEPEQIECTTLQNARRVYVPGIQDSSAITFNANYTKAEYTKLRGLKGKEYETAIWFGGTIGSDGTVTPTGTDGKMSWKGYIDVKLSGAGVNELRTMVITCTPTTDLTFE